ncbi:heme-binding protein [Polaromonas sp. P1(28)-13]|nr:heme-binding protein [Polaromonas sp. P1(28)-13]
MNYLKQLAVGVAMAVCAVSVASALDLGRKPVLSLELAEAVANACLKHQIKTKYSPINVVVVDDGGLILVSKRQDGACKACGEIAERKARTAALFNLTTRALETLSYGEKKDGVGAALPGAPHIQGIIVFPGGVPISVGKLPIGGVGVSGASGDEDEQCALAGIEGVNGLLK